MLTSMFDQLSGALARRRFMPKRLVLDLTDARERKVAVIELPRGSYAFALSLGEDGATRLTMEAGESSRVLGTFDDALAAKDALRVLKVATLRPFRKIILAAAGVLFLLFVCDAAMSPRGMPGPRQTAAAGVAPSQAYRGAGGASAPSLTVPSAAAPASAAQSSPEVAEAIRMLKGE